MFIELNYKVYKLEFKYPFGVSSNTRKETSSVFIELKTSEFIGYGEACLPAYLGETVEGTISFFEKARPLLERSSAPISIPLLLHQIDVLEEGNNAAKAAIDLALHDLLCKTLNKTIAQFYGFKQDKSKSTSFTIGIDREEILIQKLKEASDYTILKIKAGTKDDKNLISTIRKHSNKPLYVDVNQGWTDKHYVLEMILWMKEQNVILVEQPMPVAMKEEMVWVTERSPLPTIADESVRRLKDLQDLDGSFSGVNIKLMKSTGIHEALKMIDFCTKNKLLILLGCMAESSCATGAMTQLMGFANYIDLDAPMLYKNDPFRGLCYKDGKVYTSDLPGIGVEPIPDLLKF
ncbi:dipeptide epimerase [Sphingobacteriaceae bacterium]|nr:dipeptide epimerase [Sphingobacteriaceae bacterium]